MLGYDNDNGNNNPSKRDYIDNNNDNDNDNDNNDNDNNDNDNSNDKVYIKQASCMGFGQSKTIKNQVLQNTIKLIEELILQEDFCY